MDDLETWSRLPAKIAADANLLAQPALRARRAVSSIYTASPVGVYLSAGDVPIKAAIYLPDGVSADVADLVTAALVKNAFSLVVAPLPLIDITSPTTVWIKVAATPTIAPLIEPHSAALTGLATLAGFHPGQVFGIPSHATPAGAMLSSGLLGAGLGYGGSWLAERLLPDKWEKGRLSKVMGLLGGVAGVGLGALPGVANKAWLNRPFNDARILSGTPGSVPPIEKVGGDAPDLLGGCTAQYAIAADDFAARYFAAAGNDVMLKCATELSDTLDAGLPANPGPLDIDVDALGRTLWDVGAGPQTLGTTMATCSAAQRMPGGRHAGWVTPMQMANLSAHMGAGYVSGALVGTALGLLTGMPEETQNKLKQTGLYLGIVESVVPRLFGPE